MQTYIQIHVRKYVCSIYVQANSSYVSKYIERYRDRERERGQSRETERDRERRRRQRWGEKDR